MSSKYKMRESEWPYFVTFTIIRWIDIFTRPEYRNIFIDSVNYCIETKGLVVHGWVLMTNHAHLIIRSTERPLEYTIRDIKRHTARELYKAIHVNIRESRDWMKYQFEYAGKRNVMNENFQIWQNGYHPIHCWKRELLLQRLNYLHQNPVRVEFVDKIEDWKYSSATNYVNGNGLIKVELLNVY